MQEEIIHYISNARNYGLSDEEIKKHLQEAGWATNEVNEAFGVVDDFTTKIHEAKDLHFQPAISIHTKVVKEHIVPPLEQEPSKKSPKKLIFGLLGGFLIVLVVLYLFVFQSISVFGFSVFGVLLSRAENRLDSSNTKTLQISYSDPEQFSSGSLGNAIPPIELHNLQLNAQNKTFQDKNNFIEGTSSLNFQNNGNPYNLQIDYKHINDDLYIKINEQGSSHVIGDAATNLFGINPSSEWIKFKYTSNTQTAEGQSAAKTVKELVTKGIVKPKLKGLEKINGTYAFHYDVAINREQFIQTVLDQLPANDSAPSQMASTEERQTVEAVLNKLDFSGIEIWIGLTDFSIKKVALHTNAPSVASVAEAFVKNYTLSLAKSNDDQRVADIKQIRSSLELFFNDNKGYPEGVLGVPQGVTPKYLLAWPQSAPPSGNCGDYYNTYWYKHQGEAKKNAKGLMVYPSYTLTFCLGFDTADLKAGLGMANPSGITTTVACADQQHPCFLAQSRQAQNPESFSNLINDIKFTGDLSWTYIPEVGDPSRVVTAPESAKEFK